MEITMDDSETPVSDSVKQLRQWKNLKHMPTFLLGNVKYAGIGKRMEDYLNPDDQEVWYYYVIFVTFDDDVYVQGDNRHGQLGLSNDDKYIKATTKLTSLCGMNIVDIATSWYNAAVITSDGKLFIMGENTRGQLGQGHRKKLSGPREVTLDFRNPEEVVKVCISERHIVCLTRSKKVFVWGSNKNHQVNASEARSVAWPEQVIIGGICSFVDVGCLVKTTQVVTSQGEMFAWGENDVGQIGCPTTPVSDAIPMPVRLTFPETVRITKVACGYDHCLALADTGEVYSWGANGVGQLGYGNHMASNQPLRIDQLKNVVEISTYNGTGLSVCRTADGMVYVWGEYCEYLSPQPTNFKSINDCHGFYDTGTLTAWKSLDEPILEPDLKTFTEQYCGERSVIKLRIENIVFESEELNLRRSSYLAGLLDAWQNNTVPGLMVPLVNKHAFMLFIQFLFRDSTDDEMAAKTTLFEILKVARKFKMNSFLKAVHQLVKRKITTENASELYLNALKHNDLNLRLIVIQFVTSLSSEKLAELHYPHQFQGTENSFFIDIDMLENEQDSLRYTLSTH